MKKLKPVFHMIAIIAAIAEKKKVQRSHRSYENHSPAIAAKTIKFYLTDRCRYYRYNCWKVVYIWSLWSLRSPNFFFSAIAAITAMVAIIWKPGLKEEKNKSSSFEFHWNCSIFLCFWSVEVIEFTERKENKSLFFHFLYKTHLIIKRFCFASSGKEMYKKEIARAVPLFCSSMTIPSLMAFAKPSRANSPPQ